MKTYISAIALLTGIFWNLGAFAQKPELQSDPNPAGTEPTEVASPEESSSQEVVFTSSPTTDQMDTTPVTTLSHHGNLQQYAPIKTRGWYGSVDLILYPSIGAQMSAGYQWSPMLGSGLGLSFDRFGLNSIAGTQFVSVFGEMRGHFSKGKVAPFYALKLGTGWTHLSEARSEVNLKSDLGFIFNPQIGVSIAGKRFTRYTASMGVRIQNANYRINHEWGVSQQVNSRLRRYEFRIGMLF